MEKADEGKSISRTHSSPPRHLNVECGDDPVRRLGVAFICEDDGKVCKTVERMNGKSLDALIASSAHVALG